MTSHNDNHITHTCTCIIDYLCMYIDSDTHIHTHTQSHTHTYTHTHTHTCTHTHAQHACFSCCDIHVYDVTDYAAGHSYGHVHVAHLEGGGGGGGGATLQNSHSILTKTPASQKMKA